MRVLSFEFSLDHGFAWIVVDGKNEGDRWTVQCCLTHENENVDDRTGHEFSPKITQSDCGHNWGSCAESNEKAFAYWGENRCMKALFSAAKDHDIDCA